MAEQLVDLYTEEAVRTILTAWYSGEGESWPINDEVTFLVFKIIESSSSCSSDIHKVPTPAGPIGTARSVTTIGIGYIKKMIKNAGDDQHYLLCLKGAALKRKSEVKMKAYGI
ncbi:hypothetical protein [Entomomonas asaccharolytica]|uniref:Uncharacterized protein n=1 Tax=Entomomonas asaccharolytica TaxID=2785331 RepID=A0A974NDE4_9GAMM|nr:hypothetical protein [Entomomonas asaccharolytica]QQP84705.1 hypothetical protein JHT90_09825 [Entomomonas asaccharolytica]